MLSDSQGTLITFVWIMGLTRRMGLWRSSRLGKLRAWMVTTGRMEVDDEVVVYRTQ